MNIRTGYPHPIAYTYEADYHCPNCAAKRFGIDNDGFPPETAEDNEGNPIGAVAPWDEWWEPSELARQTLVCSDCGAELATADPDWDTVEEDARRRGNEDGTAAGSWVVDGNTTQETIRELIRGIEDGDPAVLDELPSAPLSGEWADGLLPRDVLGWYGLTEDDDEADDILTAYEDGYSTGVVDEVARSARAILEDES